MRFSMLLAAVVLQLTSSIYAGTVFSVTGDLTRQASPTTLSGTIEINTISGTLDSVDLTIAPLAGWQLPNNAWHLTGSVGVQNKFGVTTIGGRIQNNFAMGDFSIVLPVLSLVGYAGGSIKPTTNVLLWQSGVQFRSEFDHNETWYYPLSSGSVTPLVVPEPSNSVLAALGLIGLAVWRKR
jgi:hypothetical protein